MLTVHLLRGGRPVCSVDGIPPNSTWMTTYGLKRESMRFILEDGNHMLCRKCVYSCGDATVREWANKMEAERLCKMAKVVK